MGLRIGVKVNKTDRLPRNSRSRLNAGMRDAVDSGQRQGAELAAALTPRKRPLTYTTVGGLVVGGGDHVTGVFGSDYEVFEFLNEGTVPHEIPNAFGRGITVMHPGTEALRMLDDAGEIAADVVKAELLQTFATVFG